MLRAAMAGYESYLRIDPRGRAGELIRVRALVWFCSIIILIQTGNIIGLTLAHGQWTNDLMVAVMAVIVLSSIVNGIRYYKNYTVYAISIALLAVTGVLTSASSDHAGVNSSLIPVLVLAPMLNGFISGPRVAAATGCMMLAVIALLYYCSMTHDYTGGVTYPAREFQRVLQGAIAIIMSTIISTVFSDNIFRAFSLMEKNLARAREAEAAKAQFLAAMSHELRTPLNGVIGLSEALQKTPLSAEQVKMASGIEGSGQSLLSTLNDIMDMLKIDARQVKITPEEFDLRAFIKDVASAWCSPAMAKGLTLEAEIDHDAPHRLIGDEAHIRQVVAKIVANAIKYTSEGHVSIFAKVKEGAHADGAPWSRLEISVKDTGVGISNDAGEMIFNAFAQAESGSLRSQDGAGLGLAICQKLANLMHGEVTFRTEEGKGSTFYLDIPIRVAGSVKAPAPLEKFGAVENQFRGARVLVVEDNIINRMVAVKFLGDLGIDHEIAEDGAKCLECLKDQNFDAILMDYHMPVMDGLEATKAIRAMNGPLSSIPIIACTADTMAGARKMLLAGGFDAFLSKPVSLEDIERALMRTMTGGVKKNRVAA